MELHLNKKLFREFIDNLNTRTGIDSDIIEKDYYVCMILKELSKKQDELQAYFKGGTAVYKILDTMNRFSEDIDLTVKVLQGQSGTKNKNRLKRSALGYNIKGLELVKDECIDNKGNVIGIYRYSSIYDTNEEPLHRAGIIQVEATSFTVSEPYKKYNIEPLIYKLSNENERRILKEKFQIENFDINIIKLERMFIDKIFAAEFYYIRKMYKDVSKHLYDITVLSKTNEIRELLNNKEELGRLILYKRQEERVRKGGIDANTKIKDFTYLKRDFDVELLKEFENMQNKYVLNDKYKIEIGSVKKVLKEITCNKEWREEGGGK